MGERIPGFEFRLNVLGLVEPLDKGVMRVLRGVTALSPHAGLSPQQAQGREKRKHCESFHKSSSEKIYRFIVVAALGKSIIPQQVFF